MKIDMTELNGVITLTAEFTARKTTEMDTKNALIREGLIKLGWAPPSREPTSRGHFLYETGDEGCPDTILDLNGDVVLGLCKVCGAAEAQLLDVSCLWWQGERYARAFLRYLKGDGPKPYLPDIETFLSQDFNAGLDHYASPKPKGARP